MNGRIIITNKDADGNFSKFEVPLPMSSFGAPQFVPQKDDVIVFNGISYTVTYVALELGDDIESTILVMAR